MSNPPISWNSQTSNYCSGCFKFLVIFLWFLAISWKFRPLCQLHFFARFCHFGNFLLFMSLLGSFWAGLLNISDYSIIDFYSKKPLNLLNLPIFRVNLTFRVKSAHKLKLTDKQLLQWLFPILLVMMVYLTAWTLSDPPHVSI